MKIIDPHIHLFDLTLGDYGWLKADNPPHWPDKHKINRNFNDADISLSAPLELTGAIHIEAGFNNQQPWTELDWLAKSSQKVLGAVACCDLTLPPDDFKTQLKHLQTCSNLVGVRHILDDDALTILCHPNCLANFEQLTAAHLLFECQLNIIDTPAIEQLIKQLTAQPNLPIVINHAGFPPYNNLSGWQNNLQKLAEHKNVTIKCSGFEMIERDYEKKWQQQIVKLTLETFGTHRVMLASNFPLCLFSLSYQDYWQQLIEVCQTINPNCLEQLCHDNAKRIYQLD